MSVIRPTNEGGKPQETPIRVLLDDGSQLPAFSETKARGLGLPIWNHDEPRVIRTFTGGTTTAGHHYVGPVILRHQEDHFTSLTFELTPMDDECDAILPYWWLQEHQPEGFFDKDPTKITFSAFKCRLNCTSLKTQGKPGRVASLSEANSVPARFRAGAPLVPDDIAKRLPEHKPWDHSIDLKPDAVLSWGPTYAMSGKELKFLRQWLDDMLGENKIRPSKAPCSAPIFMVDKDASIEKKGAHEDNLRPVVDWRDLNGKCIPNRYPLPLISELQDRVAGARFFTKLDLKNGFNLIRIKPGDEWKTAFRCRYGLFEFSVMHFGMMNAPATFQAMMNGVLSDLIDQGVLVYVDDILIYASTIQEHDRVVLEVLRRLKKNGLAINPKKCTWAVEEIEYLGYIISAHGIQMSKEKVDCVLNWKEPTCLRDTQSFVGFANFYRRFIKNFSSIARSLTSSLKLEAKAWSWTPPMKDAFLRLKDAFTTAPILVHYDPEKASTVETDASDFALSGIISQKSDDGKLHPVAFHSRKLTPAEMNYEIHDKELLAIVDCFYRWRRYLEGATHKTEVFTDHHNLEYFATAKVLNRRQARWAQMLATYWFTIHYRPGAQNGKADVLSRLAQHRPEKGGDDDQPITTVLKNENFVSALRSTGIAFILSSIRLASLSTPRWDEQFVTTVKEAGLRDEEYQNHLREPDQHGKVEDGLLYHKGRLWVPDDDALKLTILQSEHDTKVAGHMGMDRTTDLIRRNFWWPRMDEAIREYVRGCLECQQNKNPRHGVFGLLQPLETRWKPWQAISMDFITDLPLSNGCDSIWVVVDMFTKMAHFIPLKVNGKKTDDLICIFAREIWRIHGIPLDIVSDRDSRFTAHLWKDFLKLVGVKSRMSTAFHPQSDGQTEIVNQQLEMYLRAFVNYEMANWHELLPMAEFAFNNAKSSTTGMTPFFANYGHHPAAHNPPTGPGTAVRNPASRLYAHWMTQVHEEAKKNLEAAKARMKHWADKHRKDAPVFVEGQLVLLNAKHIRTRRPSKKLDKKMLGPFTIQKVISPTAVRLKLPATWRIHDSFHVSLIEPYRAGIQVRPDPDQVLREAEPIEAEDFQVDRVMDSMVIGEGVKYLVKWEGWPQRRHWTWEPFDHFHSNGSKDTLTQYHRTHPDKPADPRATAAPPPGAPPG